MSPKRHIQGSPEQVFHTVALKNAQDAVSNRIRPYFCFCNSRSSIAYRNLESRRKSSAHQVVSLGNFKGYCATIEYSSLRFMVERLAGMSDFLPSASPSRRLGNPLFSARNPERQHLAWSDQEVPVLR